MRAQGVPLGERALDVDRDAGVHPGVDRVGHGEVRGRAHEVVASGRDALAAARRSGENTGHGHAPRVAGGPRRRGRDASTVGTRCDARQSRGVAGRRRSVAYFQLSDARSLRQGACGCAGSPQQRAEHQHRLRAHDERRRADLLQHLLEVPHVGGEDAQHGVRLAGDRARLDHLGEAPQCVADGRGRGARAAEQLDVALDGPAQRPRVEAHGEAGDGPVGAHPVDPPLHRRRRETHRRADLREAAAGVLDQDADDSFVHGVQRHGSISQHVSR